MEKVTHKGFIPPLVLLASVYSGLIYNFFIMDSKSMLDGSWSLLLNDRSLANIFAIVFIIFTVILILSIKYIEKVNEKLIISLLIILIGVSCFFIAGLWTLEWFILGFIIVILSSAYLVPNLFKLSSELVGPEPERDYYRLIFPASMIIWIGISAFLFFFIEDEFVLRALYIITGSLNIAGSLMIYNP